jgi:hypothetical protein
MATAPDREGPAHYRSLGGLLAFGVWVLLLLAGVIYTGWRALTSNDASMIVPIGITGLLLLALYSMSLRVSLTPDRNVVFQGLFRRQIVPVTDLVAVHPGTACIVFELKTGGALVVSWGAGEWLDLCRSLKTLNPEATLNMPGMFSLPTDSEEDVR